jgi:hypothetical protein
MYAALIEVMSVESRGTKVSRFCVSGSFPECP